MELAQQIVDEWFGPLDADGQPSEEKKARWWKKDPAFDDFLRQQYGRSVEQALAGELDQLTERAPGPLALILLLDQFTRNIYRNTPKMYAGDDRAIAVCNRLLDSDEVRQYPWAHQNFICMPLMHSEELADQQRCVECFVELANTAPEAMRGMFENYHKYAVAHHDIVARFGRFPHRNEILGRVSTAQELEFLKQPGSSF